LEKFYENNEKYAFQFQMMAYISRLSIMKSAIKKNKYKYKIIMALSKKERLEAELAQKMAELAALEDVETGIVALEDYTVEQKVKFFDSLYNSALSHVKEVEAEGWVDEDASEYMFEDVMSILNIEDTKAVWNYYNSLI